MHARIQMGTTQFVIINTVIYHGHLSTAWSNLLTLSLIRKYNMQRLDTLYELSLTRIIPTCFLNSGELHMTHLDNQFFNLYGQVDVCFNADFTYEVPITSAS